MSKLKRIGILTGGGDAPGLNAVIRAVVRRANAAGIEVIGIRNGFHGLMYSEIGTLDSKSVSGILPRGGTILGTTNRDNPFKAPVVCDDGTEKYEDQSYRCFQTMLTLSIEALIIVGGDGSLNIGNELFERGMKVIGVPKTIDNDLKGTVQTFGYDTALFVATEALDRLHTTAESHHRVMVLEVMGREAGWIALGAGIAGGAHVVLIPEIPFSMDNVSNKLIQRVEGGKPFSIVVVSEGATEIGKGPIVKKVVKDGGVEKRLGGIGDYVADSVEKIVKLETRCTVLGHLQRGGSPTPLDRILATRYGVTAAEAAINGDFGKVVVWDGDKMKMVPLTDVTGGSRRVPLDHDLIKTARALGVSLGDD